MKKTKNRNGVGRTAVSLVRKYFPQVEEVEDGNDRLEVEVTARDSNSAAARNHEGCAMAVACKRKLKADGVIVSLGVAYIIKGKLATRYRVTGSVQREIVSFDRNAGFAEGNYPLVPFSPTDRLGESRKTGPHKVTGTPRKTLHHTAGVRTVLGSKEDLG